MGDCLQTGKSSGTKVNSAFHPSGVSKSTTGLYGWGCCGARSRVGVAGDTVWSHIAGDALRKVFQEKLYRLNFLNTDRVYRHSIAYRAV